MEKILDWNQQRYFAQVNVQKPQALGWHSMGEHDGHKTKEEAEAKLAECKAAWPGIEGRIILRKTRIEEFIA